MSDFRHAAERLQSARRALMLPHQERDEQQTLLGALLECHEGIEDIAPEQIDDPAARRRFVKLQELMDTTGVPEHTLTKFYVKAGRYTHDDKIWLSDAIDGLATWFTSQAQAPRSAP